MILGIDPGKEGGLAFYNPELDFLHTIPMPHTWRMVAGHKKKGGQKKTKRMMLDLHTLKNILTEWAPNIEKVVCEEPSALPEQGITSAFSFGKTCGQIEGLIVAMNLPLLLVHPSRWKSAMEVPSDKHQARTKAMRLLPNHSAQFSRKEDPSAGRAEAALLCLYLHEKSKAV